METLQKKSLFWDVEISDPQKYGKFIVGRILAFGDSEDFKWALDFYGQESVRKYFLESKNLDKKSLYFWRQYFSYSNAPRNNQ